MRIAQSQFRGMIPRLAPELLPETAAQIAMNCRLVSGNLESWKQFRLVKSGVAVTAPVSAPAVAFAGTGSPGVPVVYAYTYGDSAGNESTLSPVSANVGAPDGTSDTVVHVTGIVPPPGGLGVRLYRYVLGKWWFVANVNPSGGFYDDQFSNAFILSSEPIISGDYQTIYRLNGEWLTWALDVDAARGPVPGDKTFRLYFTGPDNYNSPRVTDYASATLAPGPRPFDSRPLGVPAPTTRPTATSYSNGSSPEAPDVPNVTTYVYTYVTAYGEESAPSPPLYYPVGAPIGDVPNGLINNIQSVLLPATIKDRYDITAIRIYRAATGATGTEFRFVVEREPYRAAPSVPNYNGNYYDTLADAELGEVLPSALWDMPPADLRGLVALPNGVMAGFTGNQLCLSAQNFPHAWPVSYRLTTDTDIVGIGNIDTTIVIFTESFLYVASGNDPSQYVMAKFEVPYAGTSKRSVAYLEGVGVVGATADGLRAVAGIGQSVNLTKGFFTRKQWQALDPSSMLGIAHDGVYFLFYVAFGGNKGGYVLDLRPDGFGVVALSFHATAAYTDPVTGQLMLVLDAVNEPTDPLLPLPSTAPTVNTRQIYEFDSPSGTGNLNYRYRSRLNQLEYPAAFGAAQMRAVEYSNIVWRVLAPASELIFERVGAPLEFVPGGYSDPHTSVFYDIIGTSSIRNVQIAEDMGELR